MSLSNPRLRKSSPITRSYSWAGASDKGVFKHYEKTGDTGKNIEHKLPFSFIYLDEAVAISGYNEGEQSNLYSNVFRKVDETIRVKWSKDKSVLVEGSWNDENVKNKIKANGGKWTAVIFAMDTQGNLVRINMVGSSLTAWINFKKTNNPEEKPFVMVQKAEEMETKKGDTYLQPIFESREITKPETLKKAIELDKELQSYFDSFMSNEENNPIADLPNDLEGNGDFNKSARPESVGNANGRTNELDITNPANDPLEGFPTKEPAMAYEDDDLPF